MIKAVPVLPILSQAKLSQIVVHYYLVDISTIYIFDEKWIGIDIRHVKDDDLLLRFIDSNNASTIILD